MQVFNSLYPVFEHTILAKYIIKELKRLHLRNFRVSDLTLWTPFDQNTFTYRLVQ